ncbi:CHASE2 domain-containing protein [Roseibium sp. RKSG952]|uniref:CHASE2 domain-containing protein n=1 Tax=Roseibium sp. RKSG952 TaxID=2529384 RepID=UPI0018AD2D43|nr:adenylate/guanylate cyclase domain-containing protein [Roseibium sp. RKSG952]
MRTVLRRFSGKRFLIGVVATALLALLTLYRVANPELLTAIRELTFDAYQRFAPREYQPVPVRIVDIDENAIGQYGQWPWPRTRLAEVVRNLDELGAAVIAFDIVFSEPDRTSPARLSENFHSHDLSSVVHLLEALPDHDLVFADMISQAPVVLGFALVPDVSGGKPSVKAGFAFGGDNPANVLPPFLSALPNLPVLEGAASGVGGMSLAHSDMGGIVRRIPLLFSDGSQVYPGLATEALRVAQGASGLLVRSTGASGEIRGAIPAVTDVKVGAFEIPTNRHGEMWIHFDEDRPDRYVSVAAILDPSQHARVRPLVEGHIIFVGTSAAGLLDIRATPLGEVVPGVSIHAQAAEQMIGGHFIERPDWANGAEILGTFLLGAITIAALPVLGGIATAALGGILVMLVVGVSIFAFSDFGILIDPVYPSLSAFIIFAFSTLLLYIFTLREKRFVRQAFGQYLSPHLVSQLEKSPEQLTLGGEMRDMTILFMDIRGFTPISEQLTPTELVRFLNALLSPLSNAIQAEDGTIDKYIGDSIMAFWNAPLAIPNHAEHACRAALKMLRVVDRLNGEDSFGFKARALKTQTVQIGIGLNSGEACVGNMGSDNRFNYSVIGDAVNVASRIESSCKAVGADLLVSDATRDAAPMFAYLEAGEISLKGKSRPVKLFALVGDEVFAQSEPFRTLQDCHLELIAADTEGSPEAALRKLWPCRRAAPRKLAAFYDRFEERLRENAKRPADPDRSEPGQSAAR